MSASHTNDEFDELLSAYVDNELTPDERAAVQERLRTDERARQTLADLQRASSAVKSLPRVPLGRDLSASVLAALPKRHELQNKSSVAAAEPTVLAMPASRDERPAKRGRGLVWAALAVAAALMLMALRPGLEINANRDVAKSSAPRDGAPAQQTKRGVATLDRKESLSDATPTAAAPSEPTQSARIDNAARPAAAASTATSQPDRGVQRPESAQGRGDDAERQAAAPRTLNARGGASQGVVQSRPMAAGLDGAAEPAVADESDDAAAGESDQLAAAAEPGAVRTIEIVMTDGKGVADFERMLAEHRITISDGDPPADVKDAWTAARERSAGDGVAADSQTSAAEGTTAIVVDASPEVIEGVLAALELQTTDRFRLPPTEAMPAAAARLEQARDEEASAAGNVAWRLRSAAGSEPASGSLDVAAGAPGAAQSAEGQPAEDRVEGASRYGFGGGGGLSGAVGGAGGRKGGEAAARASGCSFCYDLRRSDSHATPAGVLPGAVHLIATLRLLSASLAPRFTPEDAMADVTIRTRPNGPLFIEGPFKLFDSEGKPFPLDSTKPGFALCRCGHSARKPFCDGAHKACGFVGDERAPDPASPA